jgi:hypothetical protein
MRYLINNVTLSFFEHGLVPVICNSPKVCCVKSGGGGRGGSGGLERVCAHQGPSHADPERSRESMCAQTQTLNNKLKH